MCGIAGIVNFNNRNVDEHAVRRMMQCIKHRGPDDEGFFSDNEVGLGFTRLSILDLTEAGHQPMFSENKNLTIIFNGEIFNYIELREELKLKGYKFITNTDTEVLLKSYEEWGAECLHKLNGMWAFVIYDSKNKSLFASRDRYGIKPFYYCLKEDQLIFASEIPAILEVLENKPKANNQAIFDFLVFNRTDQNETTFFEGINKLQHGHSIIIDLKNKKNKVRVEKWYDLRQNLKEPFNSEKEFYTCFKSAVDLRMRSDVPVGICLSGGLDSSSILSVLLKDNQNKEINTFSAVYDKGDKGDETEYINEYSDQVKNMHYVTPDANSFFKDINNFVKAHGEPIPSTSAYAQYRVMELAKGKVTVSLNGQGADEQLAGYHYFFGLYFKELLFKFKIRTLIHEIKSYYKHHQSLFAIKSFIFFLLPKNIRTKVRINEKGYLKKIFSKKYSDSNSIAGNLYGSKNLREALLDHFEYKMEHHLKWDDFNAMWHSIESRVPFLDHNLVERCLTLPSEKIIKDGSTKYILREAMRGVLPERIRTRVDKIGFATPEAEWFRTPAFVHYIWSILNSESFKNRNIIDVQKAHVLYDKHLKGETDISKEIWKWIHLELWFREFIDHVENKINDKQVCSIGVWDKTVPGIEFDINGVSNYARILKKISKDYPCGKEGEKQWLKYISEIKEAGINKNYDCIIGVSGGTDSSYLLHLANEYGLRPLAVYLDNGWASETAISNIEKMTKALNIDLETYVIDYGEVKDVLRSYLKASLPWADSPTDLAIKAVLFKKASRYNLKHVLIGHDFKTEGFQPTEWTYSDSKQLKYIANQFSQRKLRSFPTLSIIEFTILSYFKKIKLIKPFFYLDYNKNEAKKLLIAKYGWKDYGGHHYENIYTKFIITYWLYEKFGIDKRKITFSALILNGEMQREDALEQLLHKPYNDLQIQDDIEYLCKKLDLSKEEFDVLFKAENRYFNSYPSYFPMINKFKKFVYPMVKYFLPSKPLFIYQSEGRENHQ